MELPRLMHFVVLGACAFAPGSETTGTAEAEHGRESNAAHAASPRAPAASAQAPESVPPSSQADLGRERALLDQSAAAVQSSDYTAARVKAAEAVDRLLGRQEVEQDAGWLALLESAGRASRGAQDAGTAKKAWAKVLEVRSRTLPDDHPELQKARTNLASAIKALGDLQGARALFEKVLEVRSRTLSDDHPDLQSARGNLALTMYDLGDLQGARALQEAVLEIRSRSLPDDHPELARARLNLAGTIATQGDFQGALELLEQVVDVRSRTLPDDHPDLQRARLSLAHAMYDLDDFQGARALQEKVLEVRSRVLPDDHPDLQMARVDLASTIARLGDLQGARALQEKVLEVRSRTLPGDHRDVQVARLTLAATLRLTALVGGGKGESTEREEDRTRCAELTSALCRSQSQVARSALLEGSSREAEERCAYLDSSLDFALSVAQGYGAFEPLVELDRLAFELSEATRGAGLAAAAVTRKAKRSAEYARWRGELRKASDELAALARKGTTSEGLREALARREAVERELVALARDPLGGGVPATDVDLDGLAGLLTDRDAVVAYRRYKRWTLEIPADGALARDQPLALRLADSLCAFVVRGPKTGGAKDASPSLPLTLVDLGPIEPVEKAARAWREAIGAGVERGVGVGSASPAARPCAIELRRLVFDPLRQELESADHLVVALDDVLHLVPIDALPLDEEEPDGSAGDALLGQRWRIETRCTLVDLLGSSSPRANADTLVALGGASFNSAPLGPGAEDVIAADAASAAHAEDSAATREVHVASILRGGAWERGFEPLTYASLEAREIVALHDEVFGERAASILLEKRKASREGLEELAPRARWLHVATHGWFASESIRSWSDPSPSDANSGRAFRQSSEEQVKGMSPMLLCGLALAGANLPEDDLGRVPGLVTADEISTWELSDCELAVLSACDTNVGERRAGQGVASLQRALHMAGARTVITSLWKVPDEATKELMLDYYRRIWVAGEPKAQALWNAKMRLRSAKDETGRPRYTVRDWAAWVLTGDPN